MAEGQRFYSKQVDNFSPRYGQMNWRSILEGQSEEPISNNAIWFDSGDGLDQQCTQENTDVYLSQVSDDIDAVLVHDPRDNMRYSFFRSIVGTETFDHISHSLQEIGAAMIHYSLYPKEDLVDTWLNVTQGDLSQVDTIPDDWLDAK